MPDSAFWFRAAADVVIAVHVAFVAFVVFGALLVVRWRWLVWLHVPAVFWGVLTEFQGWICPLTPLENYLREQGATPTYQGDFIDHYVLPLLYPAHLTRDLQVWFGAGAIAVNVALYGWAFILRSGTRFRT